MKKALVAVVVFDQISPFHLAVPCAVFGDPHPEAPRFDLRLCTADPQPVRSSAGFSIGELGGLDVLRKASVVIVPSWRDTAERPPALLLDALNAAHRRGARIVGLCLGAFVLAEAGLLSGARATTHWAYAAEFAERYPDVRLDADVLYIDEGRIVTSAGTAAGLDCCLHLVRQAYGVAAANRIARRLVVPPHRQGGQAQFIEQPLPATASNTRLGMLLDKVRATLAQPHTLDSLAQAASMSRRTFTRHFRQITGMTVNHWLRNERLAMSQRLLEASEHSIERIAALSGFGSAVSLRENFRAAFGVSPTAWRQTFAGVAPAEDAT